MTSRSLTRTCAALKPALALIALAMVAACEGNGSDKTRDFGIDAKSLTELKAGIWIDPEGCDHWIIDDGLEGYLSERRDRYGKPVCSGRAPPTTVVAPEDLNGNEPAES